MPTANRNSRSISGRWGRLAALLVVFLVCFLAWRYTPLAELLTPEHVTRWAHETARSPWAPLALIAIYTPAAFLMFPRPVITMFAAIAFGPWRGFALSVIGIAASALTTYVVGRSLKERTVKRLAGKRLEKTSRAIRKRGFVSVLAVSIAPVAPFPIVGMVAGALRIKLWQYVLGTMMGMMPGTIATTVFANQIETALGDPAHINYWVVAAVFAVFVALTLLARRWMAGIQHER